MEFFTMSKTINECYVGLLSQKPSVGTALIFLWIAHPTCSWLPPLTQAVLIGTNCIIYFSKKGLDTFGFRRIIKIVGLPAPL
ncbi:MAG: hypothetical protein LBT59_01620, partial [Clostridiales bacterium]|nr:hypothetical protein [Clostridiales bacterium]